MTREDALLAMNGATLIGVADKLGVKVSCNKTRTALKEAKAKVIARILETEAALAAQKAEAEKPEEKEAEAQATQEVEKPEVQDAQEAETPEAQAAQEAETEKPDVQEPEGDKPEAQAAQEAQAVPVPTAEPEAQKAPAATAKKKKAQEPAQEPAEITAAVTVLDDIFDKLNDLYFDGLLPKAVITIRRITRTYDCCYVKKGEAEGQYNIEVCASVIGKPIEEIAAGILHAIVHIYCMEMGIVETCQKGRYHNSKFKKACEDRDLTVAYDSANGFVHTAPSDIFVENLKATGLDLNMQLAAIPAKKKGAGRA